MPRCLRGRYRLIFDHIGIFVKDISTGKELFEQIIPVSEWTPTIDDPGLNVSVCFGEHCGIRYELVAPFGSPNPVSRVLQSGRNILNHVAYRVADLDASMLKMRASGAIPMGDAKPALAFGGARVVFFLSALGFIVELIEDVPPG